MLPFTLDTVRLSLHILAVCIWIGGQLVVAAAVPVLREVGADAPRLVARRFGQVAWPAFGLALAALAAERCARCSHGRSHAPAQASRSVTYPTQREQLSQSCSFVA